MNYPAKTYSRLLLALPMLLLSLQLGAQTVKPYSAEYQLYRGGSHIANTRISLDYRDGIWTWYTETQPVGFYRLFTNKAPFAETRMRSASPTLQLSQQRIGDNPQRAAEEKSWFDHERGLIFYNKKQKSRQLKLPAEVYDYHSIHLLYRQMLDTEQTDRNIDFYKNGKLLESHIRLDRQQQLMRDGEKFEVDRMIQSFAGSDNKMIYYYQQDSPAPLKIEQTKPGKADRVMWRIAYQ